MKFHAFGFGAHPSGGLNDRLGVFDSLDEAKKAIETEAPDHAHWFQYEGHVAVVEGSDFRIIEFYAAWLKGNIDAGVIHEQIWSVDRAVVQALLSKIP